MTADLPVPVEPESTGSGESRPVAEQVLPARNDDVEVAGFDSAYVVFDPRCMQVHLVDGFAAVVFDACDGRTSRHTLEAEVSEITGSAPAEAADQIDTALAQLTDLGLLAGTTPAERPP